MEQIIEVSQDTDIQIVAKQIPTLTERATALEITDEPKSKLANDVLAAIKRMLKKLEERRLFLVKPLKDHANNIEDDIKRYTNPLNEAYKIVRQKLTKYVSDQDSIHRKEEQEKAKAAEDFLGEEVKVAPPAKAAGVTSSLGKSYVKKVWKMTEVVDITKVPFQYLDVSSVRVNNAIRSGIREIPGLKIEEVNELAIRS